MFTDQSYQKFLQGSLERDYNEKLCEQQEVAESIRESWEADDVYRQLCSYVLHRGSPRKRATYLFLDLYGSLPKIGFDTDTESFSDLISKYAYCSAVTYFAKRDVDLHKRNEYHYW